MTIMLCPGPTLGIFYPLVNLVVLGLLPGIAAGCSAWAIIKAVREGHARRFK